MNAPDAPQKAVIKFLSTGLSPEPFAHWLILIIISLGIGALGGILFDWPAHLIDQALQLVDSSVRTVFCDIYYTDQWDIDIGNYANLIITYQNDVRYQIEISNLAKSPKPRWYVQGNLGGLVKFGLGGLHLSL